MNGIRLIFLETTRPEKNETKYVRRLTIFGTGMRGRIAVKKTVDHFFQRLFGFLEAAQMFFVIR